MNYEIIKAKAKQLGYNTPDLLALSSQNDPFYAGSDGNIELAHWFAALWRRLGFEGLGGVHLRRVHYRLFSLGGRKADGTPYENTGKDWNILLNASRYARFLGLVNPEDIVDRHAPEPRINLKRPEEWEEPGFSIYPADMTLPTIDVDLKFDLREALRPPVFWTVGYDYHPYYQPYHIEVWVEKSTMNDVLEPVCDRLNTNLVTGVGYMTITSIVALLRRIEASEKPARILYVSDHDPGGKNMPIQVARQVEFWTKRYTPGADIRLTPIVLTEEQIEEYDLGDLMAPLDEEEEEPRFGEGAVELDALEARVPGELAEIVTDHIVEFRGPTLEDDYEATKEEAEKAIENAMEEALGEELARQEEILEQAMPIVERYQGLVDALARRMAREMAPLEVQLQPVRHRRGGKGYTNRTRFARTAGVRSGGTEAGYVALRFRP